MAEDDVGPDRFSRAELMPSIQQSSKLLQLPAEVRLMILKYLLHDTDDQRLQNGQKAALQVISDRPIWVDFPLLYRFPHLGHCTCRRCRTARELRVDLSEVNRSHKRYKLHPQIFSVCKLLYAEGREVLHQGKTVAITYVSRPFFELECYVVGESSLEAALKKYPGLATIKCWSIDLWISICGERSGSLKDDSRHLRDGIEQFRDDVEQLGKIVPLDSLHFNLYVSCYNRDYHVSSCLRNVVSNFRVLRAQECIVKSPPRFSAIGQYLERAIIGEDQPVTTIDVAIECEAYDRKMSLARGFKVSPAASAAELEDYRAQLPYSIAPQRCSKRQFLLDALVNKRNETVVKATTWTTEIRHNLKTITVPLEATLSRKRLSPLLRSETMEQLAVVNKLDKDLDNLITRIQSLRLLSQ